MIAPVVVLFVPVNQLKKKALKTVSAPDGALASVLVLLY
jgi:hypothetical protein